MRKLAGSIVESVVIFVVITGIFSVGFINGVKYGYWQGQEDARSAAWGECAGWWEGEGENKKWHWGPEPTLNPFSKSDRKR